MSDKIQPSSRTLWWDELSTRQSVEAWEQFYPVNITLATPGTAEDIWTVDTTTHPTINLCTNPSFETGDPPTGFTLIGSTLSQSAVQALYSTNSMLVNPDNAAANEGFYYTLTGVKQGDEITASVYVYGAAAVGQVRIRLYGSTSASYLASGTSTTLATDWTTRLSVTHKFTTAEASILVYVTTVAQHNTNFYVDGFQVEYQPFITSYCDGAQGLLYSWDGTAHASISRRRPPMRAVRGYTFHVSRDCYIAYGTDRALTSSSTVGRLVRAGTDWWVDHPVNIKKNISFINRYSGEQPQITGEIWGG